MLTESSNGNGASEANQLCSFALPRLGCVTLHFAQGKVFDLHRSRSFEYIHVVVRKLAGQKDCGCCALVSLTYASGESLVTMMLYLHI